MFFVFLTRLKKCFSKCFSIIIQVKKVFFDHHRDHGPGARYFEKHFFAWLKKCFSIIIAITDPAQGARTVVGTVVRGRILKASSHFTTGLQSILRAHLALGLTGTCASDLCLRCKVLRCRLRRSTPRNPRTPPSVQRHVSEHLEDLFY